MIPKLRIGLGDDCVGHGFGKILRICVAEWDITARQSHAGGRRKRENDILARTVIDARGLEEKSIRRIEESGEELDRREIARQIDIRECGDNDEGSNYY